MNKFIIHVYILGVWGLNKWRLINCSLLSCSKNSISIALEFGCFNSFELNSSGDSIQNTKLLKTSIELSFQFRAADNL